MLSATKRGFNGTRRNTAKNATNFNLLTIFYFSFKNRLFEFRKVMSNRATCTKLVPRDYPVEITKVSDL